nr:hypothetical protein [Oscillochloris trichoides]
MPTNEEVVHQQILLNTHRRTLRHYLQQQATLGEAYAPPGITHGIAESRSNIQKIKQILRNWNVVVEDSPDDISEINSPNTAQSEYSPSPQIYRVRLREILITYFNDEELRNVAFAMGIDYENLSGTSKSGKARELIAYTERHNYFQDLVRLVWHLRPNIS